MKLNEIIHGAKINKGKKFTTRGVAFFSALYELQHSHFSFQVTTTEGFHPTEIIKKEVKER